MVTMSAESKTCWQCLLPYFSSDQGEIWCSDEAVQAEHPDSKFEWDFWIQGK